MINSFIHPLLTLIRDSSSEERRKDASGPAASTTASAVPTPAPAKAEPPVEPQQPAVTPASSASNSESTLDNVDLAKIESILSSLSSAMKSTGRCRQRGAARGEVPHGGVSTRNLLSPSADSPPAAARPPAPIKTAAPVSSADPQDGGPLVSLLSKVDMSPADLLNALSKVQRLDSLDGEIYIYTLTRTHTYTYMHTHICV